MTIKEVLSLHRILIEQFGGKAGVRDMNALESAVSRPFATFDSNELYPHPVDKGAAIIESIVVNHPFIDGNKRIGYVVMRLLLMEHGYDISASQEEKYNFVLNIAKGISSIEDIKKWLRNHVAQSK